MDKSLDELRKNISVIIDEDEGEEEAEAEV